MVKRKSKRKKRVPKTPYIPPSQRRAKTETASDEPWWRFAGDASQWWWLGGGAVVILAVAVVLWFTVGPGKPASTTELPTEVATELAVESTVPYVAPVERDGMYTEPPEIQIDPTRLYFATISTVKGDILVQLFADRVPVTVNNFVFLAREGFYDNITFHRVIPDFMAQAGDPTGTGVGGPGYTFPDEFDLTLKHDTAGVMSMANSGANTNGSQFFITYAPAPWLDAYDENDELKDCANPQVSCHAVFGQVLEGMDVLESLTPRDPSQATYDGDIIKTINITEQ
jgi:cyclophilin family peptidyl-prolyl cis-trans isomerase